MKSVIQEENECYDEDKCMGTECVNDDKVEEEVVPVFAIEPFSGIEGQAGSVGIGNIGFMIGTGGTLFWDGKAVINEKCKW